MGVGRKSVESPVIRGLQRSRAVYGRPSFGGGGGNRTRVRQSAAIGSTCLVRPFNLTFHNPANGANEMAIPVKF